MTDRCIDYRLGGRRIPMTDRYYVERKAEDLHLGDMFVWWGLKEVGFYPKALRILDIKVSRKRPKDVTIVLDGSTIILSPNEIVIVEELA